MNVIDLLRRDGIEPRMASGAKGGEFQSMCPGCKDSGHDPKSGPPNRFHVFPEQNGGSGSWWCRKCSHGGDNVEYMMFFHGMNFREASEAVGRETDWKSGRSEAPKMEKPEWKPGEIEDFGAENKDLYREKLAKFIDWSHKNLLKSQEMTAFLKKRGIGVETAKRFLLGWNPGENGKKACYRPRKAWGLPGKVINGQEKRLWLPRGLVVPCLVDGEPVRARIRRPDEDLTEEFPQRYFVVPGGRMERFKAESREQRAESRNGNGEKPTAWVVVETELDAMMIWEQAGDIVGAMAMGTSHAKPDPECHAALSDAMCILVALDFDQAGAGGWPWWEEQYHQAERWPVPEGKDPGEAFELGMDVRAWVLAGLPPVFRVGEAVAGKKKAESLNGEKRETGRAEEPKSGRAETEKNEGLAPGVRELADLLRVHPVRIEATPRRIRIIEPPEWERSHDAESRRISRLVFQDPEVFSFLCAQRPGVIGGSNFPGGAA